MTELIHYEVKGNIGTIKIDNPPVNALSVNKGVIQGILDSIKEGEHDPSVSGFLILGAGKNFSGGADISEFGKPKDPDLATLRDLLAYMDTVTKPIIAAISGPTMGGGLELALTCHYRIASADAVLALPEVKLGILPGAGGTQRLPRIIGPQRALPLMVNGDFIGAKNAFDLGIVEHLVEGDLYDEALRWSRRIIKEGKPIKRASQLEVSMGESVDEFIGKAREDIASRWRGYPAPMAIVECVKAALTLPFSDGLKVEREEFEKLVVSNESKSLRHLFFSERQANKVSGVVKNEPQLPVNAVAVVGSGTMGTGITMSFANAGIPVVIIDTDDHNLTRGLETIKRNYDATVSKGKLSSEIRDKRIGLIRGSTKLEDVAEADLIIEAVFEEMEIKKSVFGSLDSIAKRDAILATNTSTLDINEIAAVTSRPERVIGLHFFSPANVMRLLEVVRGEKTAPSVIATAMAIGKRIKKVPVCVGVCDGFVGNRMIHRYIREAEYLIEEGALPHEVDKAIEAFGFAMGPFRMGDLAGLDIGWAIRKRKSKTRDPDQRYVSIPDEICERGWFGQKTGQGYYKYENGSRTPLVNEEVNAIVIAQSANKGIQRREIQSQEIVERLMFALVNEGANILSEGIAQRASDIDVIYAFGYGFPRYRGGPMFYANTIGLEKVAEGIRDFAADPLGSHWVASPHLLKLIEDQKIFGD